MKKLKELYQLLLEELVFLVERIAKYTNRQRSKGLDLKEEDKVLYTKKRRPIT